MTVAEAQSLGELPDAAPAEMAAEAQAFALGLVVQAWFDPAAFPPEEQVRLPDRYLAGR